MKSNKSNKLIYIVISAFFLSFVLKAQQLVEISDTSFEVELVRLGYDDKVDGKLSPQKVKSVKVLNLKSKSISDLSGIEAFKSLQRLNVASNFLRKLDLSKNKHLVSLIVSENQLSSLDLSANNKLKILYVDDNKLVKLNLQDVKTIEEVYCQNNRLLSLDFSSEDYKKLRIVNCNNNKLESLSFSAFNENLTKVYSNQNNLVQLNVKIIGHDLVYLDVSKNPKLECVLLGEYMNSEYNFDNSPKAFVSYADKCSFIDIANEKLEQVLVANNYDGKVDGKLAEESISKIVTLDLSNLGLRKEDLADILQFSQLQNLDISNNGITSLDFTRFKGLTKLKNLNLSSNGLESLDITPIQDRVRKLNVTGNPNLECIMVSKGTSLDGKSGWEKDENVIFTYNCTFIPIPDSNFEQALIDLGVEKGNVDGKIHQLRCENVKELDVSEKNISSLKGIEVFSSLVSLNCFGNKLKDLDIKGLKSLKKLIIGNNEISKLQFGENASIETLDVSNNPISALDLEKLSYLKSLDISKTMFQRLNLKGVTLNQLSASGVPSIRCIIVDKQNAEHYYSLVPSNKQHLVSTDSCEQVKISSSLEKILISAGLDKKQDGKVFKEKLEETKELDLSNRRNLKISELKAFTNLEKLNLSKNRLIGELDLTFLSNLKEINLSSNHFTTLPKLPKSVQKVDLSSNHLTVFPKLPESVIDVDLSNNKFAGSLSVESNDFLSRIVLTGNNIDYVFKNASFEGEIVGIDSKFILTSGQEVEKIRIEDANFEKALIKAGYDRGVVNGYVLKGVILNVRELNLSKTNISSVPTSSIKHFVNLEEINLSGNRFTGELDFTSLTKLTSVDLSSNYLTVFPKLPESVIDVDLSNNKFTGSLSVESSDFLSRIVLTGNNIDYVFKNASFEGEIVGVDSKFILTSTQAEKIKIEDANFEKALIQAGYDRGVVNGYVLKGIISDIKELNVSNKNISSLSGIEHFPSLEKLNASYNNVKYIDKINKSTKVLNLSSNKISNADELLKVFTIEDIDLSNNQIKHLKLKSVEIETINLVNNPLYCVVVDNIKKAKKKNWIIDTRDVSFTDTKCEYFSVLDSKLEKELIAQGIDKKGLLDGAVLIANLRDVVQLNLSNKGITSLEGIEYFENLKTLNVSGNKITKIEKLPPSLENLDISSNKFSDKELDLSIYKDIKNVNFTNNKPKVVLVKGGSLESANKDWKFDDGVVVCVTSFDKISISDTDFEKRLIKLGFDRGRPNGKIYKDQARSIYNLDLSDAGIDDLSGLRYFINLKSLDVSLNYIKDVDLSKLEYLEELNVSNNEIEELNVSNNSKLKVLNASTNRLSNIDVINNTFLEELDLSSNNFTDIPNFSHNTALKSLNMYNNELVLVDLKNVNIENVNIASNKDISCVLVDNLDLVKFNEGWIKDDYVIYSLNCDFIKIPDPNFEQALIDLGIDLGKIDGKVAVDLVQNVPVLNISGRGIKSLKGIENFTGLINLDASSNQIASVDLSENVLLETLILSDNELTNIELSSQNKLRTLDLSDNLFQKLNLYENLNIEYLNVAGNYLKDIIDFNKYKKFKDVNYSNNELKIIDLEEADEIRSIDLRSNSQLMCIKVKDRVKARENSKWLIDSAITEYSEEGCKLTEIPDPNFEIALQKLGHDKGDPDGYVLTENINKIERLDVPKKHILSIEGIQDFVSLRDVDVSRNVISGFVDFSKNKELETISCEGNKIIGINIKKNTKLKRLYCGFNRLSVLDTYYNIELAELYCFNNLLVSLDVRLNPELEYLYAYNNEIEELDLERNKKLKRLDIHDNRLGYLSVNNGNSGDITLFNTQGNEELTCIVIDDPDEARRRFAWKRDKYTSFTQESCEYTAILDDMFEKRLLDLGHDDVQDGKVKTSNINKIEALNLSDSGIKNMRGIGAFVSLKKLNISNNELIGVDLTKNTELIELYCNDNQLYNINLTRNKKLEILKCNGNNLYELDIKENTELRELYCEHNEIRTLDVSHLKELRFLYAQSNSLEGEMDLSNNTNLSRIYLQSNDLTFIDIKSFYNDNIHDMDISHNTKLRCVLVDDEYLSTENLNWKKDEFTLYSTTDCDVINIPDPNFERVLVSLGYDDELDGRVQVSNLLKVTSLNISGNNISDLSGIQGFEDLIYLDCSNNRLTSLDLTQNKKLNTLNCSSNKIEELVLPVNNEIRELYCLQNKIKELRLEYSPYLTDLFCNDNVIQYLDLSNNGLLANVYCQSNSLRYLDLQNGNTNNIENLNATDNPSLNCVLVDNPNDVPAGWIVEDYSVEYNVDSCELTYIPDAKFEQYLIDQGIDSGEVDGKVLTLNLINVIGLKMEGLELTDITGIEAFRSLEELNVSNNKLTFLNLYNNENLKIIKASNNIIKDLYLKDSKELRQLVLNENQIKRIDLSGNISLEELSLSKNKIDSIDLRYNKNIVSLDMSENELTTIDLSNNNQLEKIVLTTNKLITMNVMNDSNESIKSFDVTQNPNLFCIQIENVRGNDANERKGWDKDESSKYTFSKCYTEIPDKNFEEALTLYDNIKNDGLIPFIYVKTIKNLDVSGKDIEDLTGVEDFLSLENLNASLNRLTRIDLSQNINLIDVDLSSNQLQSLDVTNLSMLKKLYCTINELRMLDVSRNGALVELDCSENKLGTLDILSSFDLEYLNCSSNELKSLNIKVPSLSLQEMNATQNLELRCIQVQNIRMAKSKKDWRVDQNVEYNTSNCRVTEVSDKMFEKYIMDLGYDNILDGYVIEDRLKSVRKIDVSGKEITSLKGIESFVSLVELDASFNNLAEVDLSKNKHLKKINLSNNKLQVLSVNNGNTHNIQSLNTLGNNGLSCIRVDDLTKIKDKEYWEIDKTTGFTEDACNYINIEDVNFEKTLITLKYDFGVPDGKVLEQNVARIKRLDIPNMNIRSLEGIEYFRDLEHLDVSRNNLSTLNLSENLSLKTLNCSNNELIFIELYKNRKLEELYCENNKLKQIDLEYLPYVKKFFCYGNELTKLDVSKNISITNLYCYDNQLESLDLRQNTELVRVMVQKNRLKYLNIKNENNNYITLLNASENPYLDCIIVDNPRLLLELRDDPWIKDNHTQYKATPCIVKSGGTAYNNK